MRRLLSLLTAALLLAQCLGLQLVCLCGNCSLSRVWLGQDDDQASEKPCCRAARLRAAHEAQTATRDHGQIGDDDCGCSEHVLRAFDAEALQVAVVVAPAVVATLPALPQLAHRLPVVAQRPQVHARGPPPGPPLPAWLQHRRLLI